MRLFTSLINLIHTFFSASFTSFFFYLYHLSSCSHILPYWSGALLPKSDPLPLRYINGQFYSCAHLFFTWTAMVCWNNRLIMKNWTVQRERAEEVSQCFVCVRVNASALRVPAYVLWPVPSKSSWEVQFINVNTFTPVDLIIICERQVFSCLFVRYSKSQLADHIYRQKKKNCSLALHTRYAQKQIDRRANTFRRIKTWTEKNCNEWFPRQFALIGFFSFFSTPKSFHFGI